MFVFSRMFHFGPITLFVGLIVDFAQTSLSNSYFIFSAQQTSIYHNFVHLSNRSHHHVSCLFYTIPPYSYIHCPSIRMDLGRNEFGAAPSTDDRRTSKLPGSEPEPDSASGNDGEFRNSDGNKRPVFTAWLAQVNLESLPNWEEKQLFKDSMEDHNTATFPSKRYYNLDSYYQRQMEKEMKKGFAKVVESERTVFNDEEIRSSLIYRQELQRERDRRKEQEVEALKRSMQSGMAQAMKEQAHLREEMAYQYKIGNLEAAAAIRRRLEPDLAT
ncbi:hypothetical protein CASFOL_017756 [Castilleja foliolosa]|uniref:Uncharacterized protein n=1 Tax=Castilleja foliolosa TaxID=1961234 RepID=A0ABD3D7U3_9LAMI